MRGWCPGSPFFRGAAGPDQRGNSGTCSHGAAGPGLPPHRERFFRLARPKSWEQRTLFMTPRSPAHRWNILYKKRGCAVSPGIPLLVSPPGEKVPEGRMRWSPPAQPPRAPSHRSPLQPSTMRSMPRHDAGRDSPRSTSSSLAAPPAFKRHPDAFHHPTSTPEPCPEPPLMVEVIG